MPDLSTVIQFVSLCATSPCAQDMPRGEGVLVKDLLRYLIQAEIRGLAQTTRAGMNHSTVCYPCSFIVTTGFIPVMFLAGAIATPIQQHCVDEHELYTLLVPPYSCCETYKELSAHNVVQDWSSIPRNIQLHSSTPSFRYVTSRSSVYNSFKHPIHKRRYNNTLSLH